MTRHPPYFWSPEGANSDGAIVRESNHNGVYAYKTQRQAVQHAHEHWMFSDFPIVVGSILLSGTVIEHQHGYRAEFARIEQLELVVKNLFPRKNRKFSLASVQEYYGVLFVPMKASSKFRNFVMRNSIFLLLFFFWVFWCIMFIMRGP